MNKKIIFCVFLIIIVSLFLSSCYYATGNYWGPRAIYPSPTFTLTPTPTGTPLPASVFYHFETNLEGWVDSPTSTYCAMVSLTHNTNPAYTYLGSLGSVKCTGNFDYLVTCWSYYLSLTCAPTVDLTGRQLTVNYNVQGLISGGFLLMTFEIHTPSGWFYGPPFYIYDTTPPGWYSAYFQPNNVNESVVDEIKILMLGTFSGPLDIYIDDISY